VKFYRFTSFSHYKEYYIANYFYKGEWSGGSKPQMLSFYQSNLNPIKMS
jgi:hypothetical protein